MSPEDALRVVSEDYADLIIDYSGDLSVLEQFEDATSHIINFFIAVVHVPVAQITENIIAQRGYSVMPTLYGLISEASLEASGIARLRSVPNFDLRGQGVLIGIFDTGIDYTNPIFKYADNTTRIAAIWDQTIQPPTVSETTMRYGTVYTREMINEALQSEDPLSIVPSMDEVGHGTMLAGIAGGNPVQESGFAGVAPDAEFVIVKLKPAKAYLKRFFRIPEDALCYQENDMLFALDYLLDTAEQLNRPIAICVALGSSQGPNDGQGTLSSYLSLQAETRGVGIVIAAGNEGNARRHFSGTVDPRTGFSTVELNVGENESGFSMEIWGASPGSLSIDIRSPSGEYIPRISSRLDENREISFIFERTEIYVDYQMIESQSGEQLILVRFSNPDPGIWQFHVYGRGDLELRFNIWLPMGNFITDGTYFLQSDPYTTILSLGNAISPITATAYNSVDDSLYLNASRGFTSIGIIKPNLAAPGVNIISPTLDQGFAEVTGTSASAAHMAGAAALLLEWGIVRGAYPLMNSVDMKMFMIRGARRDIDIQYPNRDWGFGILDMFNVFERIRSEMLP